MKIAYKQNNKPDPSKKAGNFFVRKDRSSFFPPLSVQPKLIVGPTDDPFEKEADTTADRIMRMSDKLIFQTQPSSLPIQRKCASCEEEDKIQMKREATAGKEMTVPAIVQSVINSRGQSLERNTRSFMESRFGYDFGNVQVHNDPLAHQSSSEINALAYTHRNHIVFNAGQFRPDTNSGKELLAHELVHVIQQGKSNRKNIQRLPLDSDDLHETLLDQYAEESQMAPDQLNAHTVQYAQWVHDKANGLMDVTIDMQVPTTDPNPDYSQTMRQLNAMETARFKTNAHAEFEADSLTINNKAKSYVKRINFSYQNPLLFYNMAKEIDEGVKNKQIVWMQIKHRILAHAKEHFRRYRAVSDEIKAVVATEFMNLPRYSRPSDISQADLEKYTADLIHYLTSKLNYRLWETTCDWERQSYPTLFKGITNISTQGLTVNCQPQPVLRQPPQMPIIITPSSAPAGKTTRRKK